MQNPISDQWNDWNRWNDWNKVSVNRKTPFQWFKAKRLEQEGCNEGP